MTTEYSYKVTIELEGMTQLHADAIRRSTTVEPEMRPHLVRRTVTTRPHLNSSHKLHILFEGVDLKNLRTSISSYMELMQVSMQTIECFSPHNADNTDNTDNFPDDTH